MGDGSCADLGVVKSCPLDGKGRFADFPVDGFVCLPSSSLPCETSVGALTDDLCVTTTIRDALKI